MNFALVSAHTENYLPLAEITWEQNKKLYAAKWGYDTYARTSFNYPVEQISFERTELIIDLLESNKYDWIHASGCDTMITNFNIKLEELVDNNVDFIIATDCNNINNDSFLVRASPISINWLKYVVSVREKYAAHPWYDQQAMIESIEMMGNRIKLVPQRTLNSYDYSHYPGHIPKDRFGNDGQWQSGDFLIHWPAIKLDKRIALAQAMALQVIR